MMRASFRMRLLLGGLAAAGVVASHVAAYAVAVPDAHDRAALLHETGHSNWWIAVAVALGLLVAGVASFALSLFSRAGADSTLRYRSVAARLCALQVVGFIALESAERALSGGGIIDIATEPAVLLGTVVQVAIALLGAALLLVFRRVVVALVRWLSLPEEGRTPRQFAPIIRDLPPRPALLAGIHPLRGPPATL